MAVRSYCKLHHMMQHCTILNSSFVSCFFDLLSSLCPSLSFVFSYSTLSTSYFSTVFFSFASSLTTSTIPLSFFITSALSYIIKFLRRAGRLEEVPVILAAAEEKDRRSGSHAGYSHLPPPPSFVSSSLLLKLSFTLKF